MKALVYVAGSAPVSGQSFGEFMQLHPSPVPLALKPDSYGLLWADRGAFRDALSHDLSAEENDLLHAVQKPVSSAMLASSVTVEGWRFKPCSYVIAEEDRLFAPADQRNLAEHIRAATVSVSSGHFVSRSHPSEVTGAILMAMSGVGRPS